jgi:alcohol dehydrogenase
VHTASADLGLFCTGLGPSLFCGWTEPKENRMQIIGAVLTEAGRSRPYAESKPISMVELELDEPRPGEVLVKIEAAGLCHSDLSVVDGIRPRPMPMLLGHGGRGPCRQDGRRR